MIFKFHAFLDENIFVIKNKIVQFKILKTNSYKKKEVIVKLVKCK